MVHIIAIESLPLLNIGFQSIGFFVCGDEIIFYDHPDGFDNPIFNENGIVNFAKGLRFWIITAKKDFEGRKDFNKLKRNLKKAELYDIDDEYLKNFNHDNFEINKGKLENGFDITNKNTIENNNLKFNGKTVTIGLYSSKVKKQDKSRFLLTRLYVLYLGDFWQRFVDCKFQLD